MAKENKVKREPRVRTSNKKNWLLKIVKRANYVPCEDLPSMSNIGFIAASFKEEAMGTYQAVYIQFRTRQRVASVERVCGKGIFELESLGSTQRNIAFATSGVEYWQSGKPTYKGVGQGKKKKLKRLPCIVGSIDWSKQTAAWSASYRGPTMAERIATFLEMSDEDL